jgi:protein required for attachment to host cells
MQKQSWLVVANGSEATFFKYTDEGTSLQKIGGLGNSFGRKQDKDIVTDRPGVMSGGGSNIHGRDSMSVEMSPTDKARENFVKAVADELERARKQDKLQSIDIIAEPKTMGLLRNNFSSNLAAMIDHTVSKDATSKDNDELLKLIKKH